MNTRMDRYKAESDSEIHGESRTNRNKSKYETSESEITSNISIINTDTDTENLDIEKLKLYLEDKYNKPKEELINIDDIVSDDLDDTKEYDLKKELDEARKNKESNYEEDRFRKLRDTEYEILSSLNLKTQKEEDLDVTKADATLADLIKTVELNELKNRKSDDLMSDLIGDDNTEVLQPVLDGEVISIQEKKPTLIDELEKTKQLSKQDVEEINEEYKNVMGEEKSENEVENTFYTGKYKINDKDFDDLEKEIEGSNVFIKILILLLVVIAIVVGVFLLNKYLDLGLF